MADIFISYAREDQVHAESLARWIEEQGWSVWWDRSIQLGKGFDDVIEAELDQARAVVVLWSQASRDSPWVKNEAHEGHERECLIPVLIEEVKIPLAYRRLQAANLIGGLGACSRAELDRLFSNLTDHLGEVSGAGHEPDDALSQFVTRQILTTREEPFGQEDLAQCALVHKVGAGSIGARLGIAKGDLLISFNDTPGSQIDKSLHVHGSDPVRLRFRTVARGYLSVETTGADPGINFGLTAEAFASPEYTQIDDGFFGLWALGADSQLLERCIAHTVLTHDELAAVSEQPEEWRSVFEQLFMELATGAADPDWRPHESERFTFHPFVGLYLGAALQSQGNEHAIALVDRFVEEMHNYTTNHHAVARHSLALAAAASDRPRALALLEEAHLAMYGTCDRITASIKRLGAVATKIDPPWLGRWFPRSYTLPLLDDHRRTASLEAALGALEPHQLHLVCVLGDYRTNGPYHWAMSTYKNLGRHFGQFLPSLHVLTGNKKPRTETVEMWRRGESECVDCGHPVTLLFDESHEVGIALEAQFSPYFIAIDRDGVVKADFQGGLDPASVWDALHGHLRRHWPEPDGPKPTPRASSSEQKSWWGRLIG